jgi:cytochrome c oxidase subunit 1
MNLVVHNTSWISGHFHLTVGTAVTLSFIGIAYWLVPIVTGKQLFSKKMALAQAWTWFVGMAIFSHFMHTLGLLSMPRRTDIGAAPYLKPEWAALLPFVGIGAVIMFVSAILFYVNMVLTLTSKTPATDADYQIPWSKTASGPEDGPVILDRWKPWLAISVVLIVLNYGPTLFQLVTTSPFNVP